MFTVAIFFVSLCHTPEWKNAPKDVLRPRRDLKLSSLNLCFSSCQVYQRLSIKAGVHLLLPDGKILFIFTAQPASPSSPPQIHSRVRWTDPGGWAAADQTWGRDTDRQAGDRWASDPVLSFLYLTSFECLAFVEANFPFNCSCLPLSAISGTILAVYGSEKDDGRFLVEDHCFADMPTQLPMMGPSTDKWGLL